MGASGPAFEVAPTVAFRARGAIALQSEFPAADSWARQAIAVAIRDGKVTSLSPSDRCAQCTKGDTRGTMCLTAGFRRTLSSSQDVRKFEAVSDQLLSR